MTTGAFRGFKSPFVRGVVFLPGAGHAHMNAPAALCDERGRRRIVREPWSGASLPPVRAGLLDGSTLGPHSRKRRGRRHPSHPSEAISLPGPLRYAWGTPFPEPDPRRRAAPWSARRSVGGHHEAQNHRAHRHPLAAPAGLSRSIAKGLLSCPRSVFPEYSVYCPHESNGGRVER